MNQCHYCGCVHDSNECLGANYPPPPAPPPFVAVHDTIKRGAETIARAVSHNMAIRIANALNAYKPDRRGQ